MSTSIALDVAADEGLIKQVSRKLKEKRCGDCREGMFGLQGNSSQNVRTAFKSGMEIPVLLEAEEKGSPLWMVDSLTRARSETRNVREGARILGFHAN
jgi:hypothetical protein